MQNKSLFLVLSLLFLTISGIYAHSHSHDHSHDHHHNHNHDEQNLPTRIFKQVKEFYQNEIPSKQQQVIFSVIVVTLPSVPTFLLLLAIQRLYSKNYSFSPTLLNKLISFSVGTLLGDVLLHMMPQLFEESLKQGAKNHHHHHHHHDHSHGHDHEHDHHDHSHGDPLIPVLIVAGIMVFLIIDFLLVKLKGGHAHDHGHGHSHGTPQESEQKDVKKVSEKKSNGNKRKTSEDERKERDIQAYTFLLGDLLHNFTDGLALGAAFSNSITMGITTTFVVLVHELPHEMGDFAYLIKKNFNLLDILKTQILTGTGALIGGLVGIQAGEIFKFELLSFTAGGFLYMCLSQILPEVRESLGQFKKFSELLWTLIFMSLGILSMYYITLIE